MKIAVMQPYYYPYAGYFRLFAAVDLFVFLDCVQFNRRGYVHRYMSNGKWTTLPIKKTDRDTTRIVDLEWRDDQDTDVTPVDFIIDTCVSVCKKIGINTDMVCSSNIAIPANLKGQDRIIFICKYFGATEYINSPGGKDLYDKREFKRNGLKLTFLPEWKGDYDSIAERFKHESIEKIRGEIYAQI